MDCSVTLTRVKIDPDIWSRYYEVNQHIKKEAVSEDNITLNDFQIDARVKEEMTISEEFEFSNESKNRVGRESISDEMEISNDFQPCTDIKEEMTISEEFILNNDNSIVHVKEEFMIPHLPDCNETSHQRGKVSLRKRKTNFYDSATNKENLISKNKVAFTKAKKQTSSFGFCNKSAPNRSVTGFKTNKNTSQLVSNNAKRKYDEIINDESSNLKRPTAKDTTTNNCKNNKNTKKYKTTTVESNNSKIASVEDTIIKTNLMNDKSFEKHKLSSHILICRSCNKIQATIGTCKRSQSVPKCSKCNKQMKYQCRMCDKESSSVAAAYYHFKLKCFSTNFYYCDHCEYKAKNKYLIRIHLFRKHLEIPSETVICSKCNKSIQRGNSIRHMKYCGLPPYLKCKFCTNFKTKFKASLRRHVHLMHKDIDKQLTKEFIHYINKNEKKLRDATNKAVNEGQLSLTFSTKTNAKDFTKLYCIKCSKITDVGDGVKITINCILKCQTCTTQLLFQCVKCGRRYKKIRKLYSHLIRICAPRKTLKCHDCDYETSCRSSLKIHIERKHTCITPEDYEACSKCGKKYKHRIDRTKHEKQCGNKKMFKCQICNFQTKSKQYFLNHVQDHMLHPKTENKMTNQPTTINATIHNGKYHKFSRMERLKLKEMVNAHCLKCDEKSKYVKRGRNKCRKCEYDLRYPCEKCDKIYADGQALTNHLVHQHLHDEIKKRQLCLNCGKKYHLIGDLRRHLHYCVKGTYVQCAHCRFKTKSKERIIKHLEKRHSSGAMNKVKVTKIYKCDKCDKAYATERSLKEHKRLYCGKVPSSFCAHCPYKCFKKSTLIVHLKAVHTSTYTGTKLQCHFCGKINTNIFTHDLHIKNCNERF